ncbi:MAG: methyltransferase domain-containing protein [Geminicoccaceae bacterium]|jgi:SAM-dependent methyltransferase|nr:methyltransferase domain-containing protein [Geminicoccaceae bacterium]
MAELGPLCRSCGLELVHEVLDLGMSPLCESFLRSDQLDRAEAFYPLKVLACAGCGLVQLREYVSPDEIFGEYAYFSSFSESWVRHAAEYCRTMHGRLGLGGSSLVVELGSNDGYLLQHFGELGVPVLGIEPAANVAAAAEARGVPTRVAFFGTKVAGELLAEGRAADLIVGNNVLAQVPDLNDFVAGIALLLKPTGTATLEFPSLEQTIAGNQFDQVYHEHFSYFSLIAVEALVARHGLVVADVEELASHGGSLRVHLRQAREASGIAPRVEALRARELAAGCADPARLAEFGSVVEATKRRLLSFLIEAREAGKRVVGYGAPGKGNTLLNYCGIRTDFLDYLVDRNPYKHGRFTPGTHIPIFPVERIAETRPDYLLILPWNLRREIVRQMAPVIAPWGGRLVVPIPKLEVIEATEVAA